MKRQHTKTSPMIGKAQVRAELNRLERIRRTDDGLVESDWRALYGARQALGWVLQDNAMIPSKAFGAAAPRARRGGKKEKLGGKGERR